MRQNGLRSNVRFPYAKTGMKAGGSVKKQGYNDRKDESIAMRKKKKRTKKQLVASRNESYGKFGSAAKKAKGGSVKKQGANDRLDESLGSRRGKESTKSQSYKSRRDESRGASK